MMLAAPSIATPLPTSTIDRKVPSVALFDGLRGLLALWVYMSHVLQLNGTSLSFLSHGGVAVDLFMMTSGFLMVWTFRARESKEPLDLASTWRRFYARRVFRIVPLYYLAFMVAFAFGPALSDGLRGIYASLGDPFDRPFAACGDGGLRDIAAHLSLTFGLFPCYAASDVLPDWSLSLEAQFYLLFPLLLVAMLRLPRVFTVVATVAIVAIASRGIAVYAVDQTRWYSFPQPSILPLRLNCFIAGMWLADMYFAQRARPLDVIGLLVLVIAWQRHTFTAVSLCVIALLAEPLVRCPRPLRAVAGRFRAALESPVLRWLGDVSYGVYLLHLLVLIPVLHGLVGIPDFVALPASIKALLTIGVTLPLVALLAWASHRLIEQPMISRGRRWCATF